MVGRDEHGERRSRKQDADGDEERGACDNCNRVLGREYPGERKPQVDDKNESERHRLRPRAVDHATRLPSTDCRPHSGGEIHARYVGSRDGTLESRPPAHGEWCNARQAAHRRRAADVPFTVQGMQRSDVVVCEERPTRDELVSLYESVGWTAYTQDAGALERAVAGSSYVVAARAGGELVAIGRAVSDDASVCYIQDLLVHPAWQRQGLGRRLTEAILNRYRHVRQRVLLTDDTSAQRAFYEALGFEEIRDHGDGTLRAFVRLGREEPSRQ